MDLWFLAQSGAFFIVVASMFSSDLVFLKLQELNDDCSLHSLALLLVHILFDYQSENCARYAASTALVALLGSMLILVSNTLDLFAKTSKAFFTTLLACDIL